jgi:hypothetical protein
MPPQKRSEEENREVDEMPTRRVCATDEVNERLLRTVDGYAEARSEIENRTGRVLAFGEAALRTGCTEIPVVVHVVYRNSTENISDAQIQSQIDVLNADFRASNPDRMSTPTVFQPLIADARITFRLATTDPSGNPTTGITRTQSSNTSFTSDTDNVKSTATGGADPWPADRYLNVWTCGNLRDSYGRSLLGYAQFPGGPTATDGVVILHSAFGTTGTASAPFNLGRTTTHEIGHWLNLRHIWGDDGTGCSGSDFVADTPNAAGPNYGAPTFPHVTCSNGPNGDLFMNYMDYVHDVAMFMFTAGQVARMQAALDGPRSSIGTSGPCDKDGPKDPIKDSPKDLTKDFTKDPIKDPIKDGPKDPIKDSPKDGPKDPFKDSPKDFTKDPIKDPIKDGPKDPIKDSPKEGPKDVVKDPPKEGPKDLPGDLPIPPIPPIPPIQGAQPFVLGGQPPTAGTDPLLPVVQQVGMLLVSYATAAAQGQLDPADVPRWQALSAIYAQLVPLLR